jgi:predicted CoA-binding protein
MSQGKLGMPYIPGDGVEDPKVKEILSKKNIAVVGASRDLGKAAGSVPAYMLRRGYNVIPVNPFADRILERRCYRSLADVEERIDLVDVFRPSEEAARVVEEAAARGVKVVWLQEGIYSPEAESKAKERGVTLVWNRCVMKEHQRLHGVEL